MKRNIKIVITLIVLSIIGILIYRSPDEAYWIEETSQDAIEVGHTYAYYLVNSYQDRNGLLKMSIDPAKAKIENSNFQPLAMMEVYEQLKKKQITYDITYPLLVTGQPGENTELITLEKLESFIVMTFAYKSGDKIIEIPEKGKMLVSIGVRYYNPIDNRLLPKLIRKIANLPLLRLFTGQMGTTGRWMVFDYNYKYNLRDYFDWVLNEGENYTQKKLKNLGISLEGKRLLFKQEESQISQRQFYDLREKILKSADRSLNFLYGWGSMEVERQIERIEGLYNAHREVKKNDKFKTE